MFAYLLQSMTLLLARELMLRFADAPQARLTTFRLALERTLAPMLAALVLLVCLLEGTRTMHRRHPVSVNPSARRKNSSPLRKDLFRICAWRTFDFTQNRISDASAAFTVVEFQSVKSRSNFVLACAVPNSKSFHLQIFTLFLKSGQTS